MANTNECRKKSNEKVTDTEKYEQAEKGFLLGIHNNKLYMCSHIGINIQSRTM